MLARGDEDRMTSAHGTNRTNRTGLTMSVDRGRAEVAESNRRFGPLADEAGYPNHR
jgi:hypothetical protein